MIRVALLGCGRIAKRHAEILGSGLVDGARLSAVCDVRQDRAQAFAERYRVPAYDSMEALLGSSNIDMVAVLTPSGMHADHAVAIANAGKHVLVEKPMALKIGDADRMIHAARQASVRLFVVKQNRFNLPVMKAREALEAGRFGKLVLGTVRVRWSRDQAYYSQDSWRGTWLHDGGVLANQASHHVDMLTWFMGPVQSVHARSLTALADIQTEDTAVATVRFANGALGVIEATTATRPKDLEGSLSILGSGGAVEIGGFAVNEVRHWYFVDELEGDAVVRDKFSVNPPNVYGFGHQAYYQHVIDALMTGRRALVEGEDGRASLELLVALYESIESGVEVHLPVDSVSCRLGRD